MKLSSRVRDGNNAKRQFPGDPDVRFQKQNLLKFPFISLALHSLKLK